uniref:Uncharacterized protein n=1 Tax=Clastoptera arizonana TaxID=38151 RepID=A0A1B6CW21_9HEMI
MFYSKDKLFQKLLNLQSRYINIIKQNKYNVASQLSLLQLFAISGFHHKWQIQNDKFNTLHKEKYAICQLLAGMKIHSTSDVLGQFDWSQQQTRVPSSYFIHN